MVGRNFQRVRRLRGLTQQQVEERSGFSQAYLSRLETGHQNPSIISLFEIAEALDASVLDLLVGAPAPKLEAAAIAIDGHGALTNMPSLVEMDVSPRLKFVETENSAAVSPRHTDTPIRPPFMLTDDEWKRVRQEGPIAMASRGGDVRTFLEAVLWHVRTGRPWRDLPAEFGNWNTVYRRYRDWARKNAFACVFHADLDLPVRVEDGAIVIRDPSSGEIVGCPLPARIAVQSASYEWR